MRRKFVLGGLVLALAVTALALAGGGAAKSEQEPFKVAWIYPGPHNDGGWSQAHDKGRLVVQKALGSKVETTYKENIFSNAQVPQVVASLVRDGYKMIFGTSFGIFELGVNGQLYKKYPDVLFEQATGHADQEEPVASTSAPARTRSTSPGMAAGAATKKGADRLHRPVRHPRGRPARQRVPARRAGDAPGREGEALWTNAWFSPPKETAAAKSLVAAGVDVLGQNVDSPAAGAVAETKGIPWVGYDSNAQKFAPKQWLTAAIYNWGAVLRAAGQGGDERDLEAGLLLRHDQGRLHRHRSVRPEGDARRRRRRSRRRRRRSSRASSTSSQGRSTTRRASWWCRRARR